MSGYATITVNASSWARVTRERDEAREQNEEQARLLAMSADREEKLRAALRGLIFFAEEDQHFAAPAYRKAFLRAQEALK